MLQTINAITTPSNTKEKLPNDSQTSENRTEQKKEKPRRHGSLALFFRKVTYLMHFLSLHFIVVAFCFFFFFFSFFF